MIRFALFLLALLVLPSTVEAQATIFGCDFQDTSPYNCVRQGGNTDLTESGTSGTCGVASADFQHAQTASGGFNNRGYITFTYCSTAEGGGSGTFPSGFTFTSPSGATDDAWPGVTTFYGRFRIYPENDFDTGTETVKWFRGHQDVFTGDQRIIGFLEPPIMCGESSVTHWCFAFARNIGNGSGPGNPGTDVARCAVPIGTWSHVQFSWRHGAVNTSFIKCWVNNNNEASPTAQDLSLTSSPTVPGGQTWARDDAGYQGDWSIFGASSEESLSIGSRITGRLMDWQIGDTFDVTWSDTGGAPVPATPTRFRVVPIR